MEDPRSSLPSTASAGYRSGTYRDFRMVTCFGPDFYCTLHEKYFIMDQNYSQALKGDRH